jgi:hypothetical protein
MPPTNLPHHLTPSASHVTLVIIPPLYRAWVHSCSMGQSWALAGKNGIRSCICSYGTFMVQGFKGWPIMGSTATLEHLELGMARDGHTSGQHPSVQAPRASQPMLESRSVTDSWYPSIGGIEPLDWSDDSKNYMNQPSGMWSASPA